MASIIPKISVGLGATKRSKHNLSFDCSTTANIGSCQPTMCREIVPNSKIKVKVSSLVRLASMPLPTFGRMSLRHYHTFVPLVDLYEPFDAMMSGQHYTGTSGTFVPTQVPQFNYDIIKKFICNYSDISVAPDTNIDKPLQIGMTNVSPNDGTVFNFGTDEDYETYEEAVRACQAYDLAKVQTAWTAIKSYRYFGGISPSTAIALWSGRTGDTYVKSELGKLLLGSFEGALEGDNPDDVTLSIDYADDETEGNIKGTVSDVTVISPEGADLIAHVGSYYVLFKFKPLLKRLRTIFIGLGFQFSPYNPGYFSVLKLLAYYKAWFNLFCPNREKAFVDTNCYKIIKNRSMVNGMAVPNTEFEPFLHDLAQCYYYLPMDYFSMSVLQPQKSNQDTDFQINSGASLLAPNTSGGTVDTVKVSSSPGNSIVSFDSSTRSPMTLKLAFQMLKWANKNTVIGRSIREYLKVHFGVDDVNPIDDGGVYRVGSSRTNISISDVMSTAESEQGYLGEYGGKGIGYGDSETFDFTADKFGYFITITCVVPESGYYQGYLKENHHVNRYDFFNPEFDALGYQVLERGEIMDDYNCDSPTWNPKTDYERDKAFGFVPRYSEYKVGRNIVNGDLSLIGLYNSMSPYTLDRRFAGGSYKISTVASDGSVGRSIVKPDFVPSVVYDAFRRIDPTDHIGQYNRIFNYGGNDLDHFIIHSIFDVELYAPMKSLTNSFDTVDENEPTIDVSHA